MPTRSDTTALASPLLKAQTGRLGQSYSRLGLRPVVSLKPGHQTAALRLLVLSKLEVKWVEVKWVDPLADRMAVRWADLLTD